MNVSTILFHRNGIINKNIENKTVLDKTGYKKPITQPGCFVNFCGKTPEKMITVEMGQRTLNLFNEIRKIYDGMCRDINQKIIENLTKGIAVSSFITLKPNKLFDIGMTDKDSENPTELMKTPENDNNYQLTYKDEKNNTQKIVLANDTIQIEPTSVLSSQNLDKIVFYKLNKLKSAQKTANIIKSRLELKNTLHEKSRDFMKSYVEVNNPWEFPSQLCLTEYGDPCMRWAPGSLTEDAVVRELTKRKNCNGKDMHDIYYAERDMYKIENLDQLGNTVSYYKVEQKSGINYISEFVSLKQPGYKTTYDYYGNARTTFQKDGLEFSASNGIFGIISTKIKDIGEVTTGNNWIKIKKDDTTEYFKFSEENEKSQKLTEYSVTDKDGVVRKYNLLNFEILESVREGDVEVFYNKDGSKNKEIKYYNDGKPKTIKIYGADESVEKELFYNGGYRNEVFKTVIYNGGIKEKEFGTRYTAQYRTDGTQQSKTFKECSPPEIFKYSRNENFRKIGYQSSKETFTENYAEDGKTLVSYTYNGETETLEQLNKDKAAALKQEALAEKAKKSTKTKKTSATKAATTKKKTKSAK